ncbi:MAG: hypothetical protein HY392_01385 [Candidatus Diapherotrites archaeon]|nr:hypothetical protein [Candidatus Diapherotrites archaeon]
MLHGKKRLVVQVFAIIYVVLFTLSVWLVFFNWGLDIIQVKNGDGEESIFLKNSANRTIKDASLVTIIQGKEIVLVAPVTLDANQAVKADLSKIPFEKNVLLAARAPYYQEVRKNFFLDVKQKEFFLVVDAPAVSGTGEEALFTVQVCSSSDKDQEILIQALFPPAMFDETESEKTVVVRTGECVSEEFTATPSKEGTGEIVFNIQGESFSDQIKKAFEAR